VNEGSAFAAPSRDIANRSFSLPLGEGEGRTPDPTISDLIAQIADRLIARGEVVAVAESSTGGLISDWLTNRPGCSAWYVGGVIAYSAASKRNTASVSADTLRQHGAVSMETAHDLARGATRLFDAAWGIGETGIAGPQTGRRSTKPTGYGCVAVVGPDERGQTIEVRTGLDDRVANKEAFAEAALRLLLTELERA
jgi:PncC family amidohydrolase